jgi:hypothetical protein
MDISQQLKPCPFCGFDDPHLYDEFGFYNVICSACGAEGPSSDVLDEDNSPAVLRTQAINRWNGITSATWEREFDSDRLYENKGAGEHVQDEAEEEWINFDSKWRESILGQEKKAWVEKGGKNYSLEPTIIQFDDEEPITISIDRVEIKCWEDFDESDIQKTGFEERRELKKEIEEKEFQSPNYMVVPNTIMTLVEFSLIEIEEDNND